MSEFEDGSFRFGGIDFTLVRFAADELAEWRSVRPTALDDPPRQGGAGGRPLARAHELDPGFLRFAARLTGDDEVRVLSPWPVHLPEFGWPPQTQACGCLGAAAFGAVVQALNGEALVPTPGPVCDRFLVRVDLAEALRATPGVDEVPFDRWAAVVGVDHAYLAPGFVDLTAPARAIRRATHTDHAGEEHEAFLRAYDAYLYGGLPARLGSAAREAYLTAVEAEHGFDYVPGPGPAVHRRVVVMNSVRLRRSLCCTVVEQSGEAVFASPQERLAAASRRRAGASTRSAASTAR